VISPVVEGDQLDIHPLLVFLGVLVGATLAGPAGAFVAVPAVAVLDIVIREVVVPWRHEQLSRDEEEAARVGLEAPARAGPPAAAR
jgi:predicted PurR-regulated permease PerM